MDDFKRIIKKVIDNISLTVVHEFITEREEKIIGKCNVKVEMISLKFLV